jgi:hypothetical protein
MGVNLRGFQRQRNLAAPLLPAVNKNYRSGGIKQLEW